MSDGKLAYDITADSKGFEGSLSRANGSISRLGGGISGLTAGLARMAGPIAALGGLAGGIAGLGKALKGAADLESTSVAFRTLVGDAEQADAVLQRIRDLGASTPFEFPELAAAGQKLIAFGTAADEVPAALGRIGDVASGVGAGVGEIAEIFGKAQVAGTLYAEDINQLVGRGIPVIQEFAKQLGVSESEVKKMASEGKISFSMLDQAFSDLTGEGGKFHNMMAEQSQTTNGLLSTLRDNVNNVFVAIGQPINEALKPYLEEAIAIVQRLGTGIAAAIQIGQAAMAQGKMGELLGNMLKLGAMQGVNFLAGALRWAAQIPGRILEFAFKQVVRMVQGDFNDVFTGMATGLGLIFKGVGDLIRSGMGDAFNGIVARFQAGLTFAVEKVLGTLSKIPFLADKLGLEGYSGRTFDEILEEAMGASDSESLKKAGEQAIQDGLGAMGQAIKSRGEMLLEDIGTSFGDMEDFEMGDVFGDATDEVKAKLASLAQSLDPEAFQKLLGAIRDTAAPIKKAADEAGKGIQAAPKAATNASPETGGASEDESGKKKIRLYGLEESKARAAARMSDVDKAKASAGTGLLNPRGSLPEFRGQLPSFGGVSGALAAASGAAPAMTPPTAREKAADRKKSSPEGQLLAVLREISGNTAPLREIMTT